MPTNAMNTRLPATWTFEDMAKSVDPRVSAVRPTATAEQYEAAIQHCERVFKGNKSRKWVLKILRERLAAES